MKIITKLKIYGVFAVILIIILGLTTHWRASQVKLAFERDKIASSIVKEAFILNILTGDYIQTHGERSEIQWISQQKILTKIINSYITGSKEEQRIIENLKNEEKAVQLHFSQLRGKVKGQQINVSVSQGSSISASPVNSRNIRQAQVSVAAVATAKEREMRLAAQLSLDMQNIVAYASQLSDINSKRLSLIFDTTYSFLISIITVLGVLLSASYFLLAKNISKSIRKLAEGTKKLASNQLNFRFDIKSHDELGELEMAFNNMAARLQEIDVMKADFISMASHELRTPLSAIKGFVAMLNAGNYGVLDKKFQRPLQLVATSTDRLINIVNEMLDVSRIEAGRVVINPKNYVINDLLTESLSILKPLIAEKKLNLEIKESKQVNVYADKEKIIEIMNNLVGNSLKFTEKGGISINIEDNNEKVIIYFTDTGQGMAADDQSKLFNKFEQIKSKKAGKAAGTGLGLYISREFARKMGGDLWIEKSVVGKGTTFALSLPSAKH